MRTLICLMVLAVACMGQPATKIYVGAWPGRLLIIDEATGKYEGDIPLKTGVVRGVFLTRDHKKMIVTTVKDTGIEVVDLQAKTVISSFSLSSGNKKIRLRGTVVDPEGKLLYAIGKEINKEIDRFTIGTNKFYVVDIEQQKIVRVVDPPKEEVETLGGMMRLSPDGKSVYVFGQNILVFDTQNFKLLDKQELQRTYSMAETLSLGGDLDPFGDPAVLTSSFMSTDPIVHRSVFGIARIDLNSHTFDFHPVGPSAGMSGPGWSVSSGIQVTPDRKTGFAIAVDGEHGNRVTQFLEFDMEKQKLVRRVEFAGRTRFSFAISSTGKHLYIYGAGNTIEIYDVATLKLIKTIEVDGDMTSSLAVVAPASE
jgi:DNA-binding beta-propeller fold protein YncE